MKQISCVVLLVLICALLSACINGDSNNQVGNSDWSYELSNDYVIWHINSKRIICGKKNSENSISHTVGDYVVQFCYNQQYICLQCANVSDEGAGDVDMLNLQFYIVDTVSDEVLGPFSEDEYNNKVKNIKPIEFTSWISTKPKPEGVQYN